MRIADSSATSQPPTTPMLKPAAAKSAAAPTMAQDAFSVDNSAVNVVTFNVAGGASAFKLEAALMATPLFKKLVAGEADAPIVACQEMTPALAKKLVEASKNGNFEVVWPGQTWVPGWVPTSTLMQGNLLLVPKRYQVQKTEEKSFSGRSSQLLGALKGMVTGDKKPNDLLLALQDRGYVSAELKDSVTGKRFSVIATHVAYQDQVRRTQTPQLVEAVKQAQAKGPTVLMGDFNVPTLQDGKTPNQGVVDFWKALEPAKLKDVGPTGEAGASFWSKGENIDAVLTSGFDGVSSQMLTGTQMNIPGRPDARQISDHYAEAVTLTFS